MKHTIAEKVGEKVWVIINNEIRYVFVGEPNIPENEELRTLIPQRNITILNKDGDIIGETIMFDCDICYDTAAEAGVVYGKRVQEEIQYNLKLNEAYMLVAKNYCRTHNNGKENNTDYLTGFIDALTFAKKAGDMPFQRNQFC